MTTPTISITTLSELAMFARRTAAFHHQTLECPFYITIEVQSKGLRFKVVSPPHTGSRVLDWDVVAALGLKQICDMVEREANHVVEKLQEDMEIAHAG